MKRGIKQQQGMSFITLLFLISAFIFVVFVGLKVVPIYTDNYTIKAALESLHEDVSMADISRDTVYDKLYKRLMVNNISVIDKDDIVIKESGGTVIIRIDYVDEREVMGNLSVVAYFSEETELSR